MAGAFYTAGLTAIQAGTYDAYLAGTVWFQFLSADYVFDASHGYSDLQPYWVGRQSSSTGTTFTGGVFDLDDFSYTNSWEGNVGRYIVVATAQFGPWVPLALLDPHGGPVLLESPSPRTLEIQFHPAGVFDSTAEVVYDPYFNADLGVFPAARLLTGKFYDGAADALDGGVPSWEGNFGDVMKVALVGSSRTKPSDRYTFDSSHATLADVTQGTWATATLTTTKADDNQALLGAADVSITLGSFDTPDDEFTVDGIVVYANDQPGVGDTMLLAYIDEAANDGLPFTVKSGDTVSIKWWNGFVGLNPFDSDGNYAGYLVAPDVTTLLAPPEIQYDEAVLAWFEQTLRSKLSAKLVDLGLQEYAGTHLSISSETPASAAIQARSDATPDERGHPPQHTAAVWGRVVQSDDHHHLSYGVGYTTHRLQVLTMCHVTDQPDSATPTTQPSGYKRAMRLARAVQVTLERNLGSAYGVVNLRRVAANRIQRPAPNRPSWHVIIDTYDVLQRVYRRLSQEE